jgi:hypothetical protein
MIRCAAAIALAQSLPVENGAPKTARNPSPIREHHGDRRLRRLRVGRRVNPEADPDLALPHRAKAVGNTHKHVSMLAEQPSMDFRPHPQAKRP